jgi:ATP-dependent Clp protease ATP-binding subunit ClpA
LLDASAIEVLVAAGYDRALGARPMRRAVSRLIESKLARLTLAGEVGPGDTVCVRAVGDSIELELRADAAE